MLNLIKLIFVFCRDGLNYTLPANLTLDDYGDIGELIRLDAVSTKPIFNHTERWQNYYENSIKWQIDNVGLKNIFVSRSLF